MFCECKVNYFTMNRGDSYELPLVINGGTEFNPKKYILSDTDKIYVGIMEPNQSFEDALIRKVITSCSATDCKGNPLFILEPEDTEYVLTGKYFITAKLVQNFNGSIRVTTILPMKEFFIEGTDKHVKEGNFVTHTININSEDAPKWERI